MAVSRPILQRLTGIVSDWDPQPLQRQTVLERAQEMLAHQARAQRWARQERLHKLCLELLGVPPQFIRWSGDTPIAIVDRLMFRCDGGPLAVAQRNAEWTDLHSLADLALCSDLQYVGDPE